MIKSSKEAKYKEKSLRPYQRSLDKWNISYDHMEDFCKIIEDHSQKKLLRVITSKLINKKDYEEPFEFISKYYKDEVPMKKRDYQRWSYKDINMVFNAIAAENAHIMRELAKNFHNFKFYSKLNNPKELEIKWNQKVDEIQNRISIFDPYDDFDFPDEFSYFW